MRRTTSPKDARQLFVSHRADKESDESVMRSFARRTLAETPRDFSALRRTA
jgi:hypothetical protein